jgi:hypothetical protein
MHRRKSDGDFADDAALGSRAFTGIARAVWHLSKDFEDEDLRLLLPGKLNLTCRVEGLSFRIEGSPARVVWEDEPVAMTADDAQAAEAKAAADKRKHGPEPERRQEAIAFLQKELAGCSVAVSELKLAAKKAGIAWRTVERAANDLGVIRLSSGFAGGWSWRLPESDLVPTTPAA